MFPLLVRAVELELGMWRRMLETDARWNWQDNPLQTLSHDSTESAEKWPTPNELFFETGIVLGAVLGICAAVDVLLTVLGIPDVY